MGNVVVRAAQGNRIQTTRRGIGHAGFTREYDCERPRPERVEELLRRRRNIRRYLMGRFLVRYGQDERIIAGPSLGSINAAAAVGIKTVGTNAIYRFCREYDDTTIPDDAACFFQYSFIFFYVRYADHFCLFHTYLLFSLKNDDPFNAAIIVYYSL